VADPHGRAVNRSRTERQAARERIDANALARAASLGRTLRCAQLNEDGMPLDHPKHRRCAGEEDESRCLCECHDPPVPDLVVIVPRVEYDRLKALQAAAREWRTMRADTPTRPRPESAALIAAVDALDDRTADEQTVADALVDQLQSFGIVLHTNCDYDRAAIARVAVAALDLPGRDARIRAAVAEEIAVAIENRVSANTVTEWERRQDARIAREHATAPGEEPTDG